MKNKKQKQNRNNKKIERNVVNSNQILIDQSAMTDAIVMAYKIIEEQKKEKEFEQEEKAKQDWLKIMGQKELSKNNRCNLKIFNIVRNDLCAMKNLFFLKSKNARDLRATCGLMQLSVIGILGLCKWSLYVIAMICVFSVVKNGVGELWKLAVAFLMWAIARLFRVASFEVEKIKDGNLVIALFSGSVSFVAMITSIVSILIGLY